MELSLPFLSTCTLFNQIVTFKISFKTFESISEVTCFWDLQSSIVPPFINCYYIGFFVPGYWKKDVTLYHLFNLSGKSKKII